MSFTNHVLYRNRRRRSESFAGSDRSLAKRVDDLCRSVSGTEIETADVLFRQLRTIERGASDLGLAFSLQVMNGISGSPHYAEFTVDEFMVKASKLLRDDSIYLSIDFVDGAPGDQYMLCIHDYDDPDAMEECAQFLFS